MVVVPFPAWSDLVSSDLSFSMAESLANPDNVRFLVRFELRVEP
jgi:hypothetical protein